MPRSSVHAPLPLDADAGRGKVALVTGASSGIGQASVTRLLQLGFEVWGAARRVERMSDLEAQGMRVLSMDLTDDQSMISGVDQLLQSAGRLDVLVNNAGYGSYGPVEHVPMDEARRQFEVNVFGLARLVQLVTPTMRAQHSGRIINVSSIGGKIYEPLGAWYHSAKFAVEGLSDSLRVELRPFGVDVVLIEPGPIATEWTAIARESLEDQSRGTAYEPRAKRMAKFIRAFEGDRFASSPDVVARKIALAAVSEHPRSRYPVGVGAGSAVLARRVLGDSVLDRVVGAL